MHTKISRHHIEVSPQKIKKTDIPSKKTNSQIRHSENLPRVSKPFLNCSRMKIENKGNKMGGDKAIDSEE